MNLCILSKATGYRVTHAMVRILKAQNWLRRSLGGLRDIFSAKSLTFGRDRDRERLWRQCSWRSRI
jgi:hypothetical protein